MIAQVYFHPQSVPHTVTRKEWYAAWRKVRMMKNTQRLTERSAQELLRSGSLPEYARKDIIEHMINPPLILGPFMDLRR